jgi:hypothetical protein
MLPWCCGYNRKRGTTMSLADKYRAQAAELVAMTQRTADPSLKLKLVGMAQRMRELAELAEELRPLDGGETKMLPSSRAAGRPKRR